MKTYFTILALTLVCHTSFGQATVEAEFETAFHYQFVSLNPDYGMINVDHPVLATRRSANIMPDTIKFLCGAAIFRNPEDNILSFPRNTINFTPTHDGSNDIEEMSDSYARMIGFNYGQGRVIVCTDQDIFRSLDLCIDGEKIPVTIHDAHCDNADLFLNSIRWLVKLQ
jgi:hypothetical protein